MNDLIRETMLPNGNHLEVRKSESGYFAEIFAGGTNQVIRTSGTFESPREAIDSIGLAANGAAK